MHQAVSLKPKLRFSDFSSDWKTKTLGDFAELTSSKRVYLSDYVSEGIPFYRGKEISELKAGKKPEDILYISKEDYEKYKNSYGVPQIGDILITSVGTLGNTLLISDESEFYFKDGNLIWLRNIEEQPEFIDYVLQSNYKKVLKTAIGSSQKALTIVGLNKLQLALPGREEQKKIADFLSTVDSWIQNLKSQKEELEKYKQGIMQKFFSQEIRFKDDFGNEYPDWEKISLEKLLKYEQPTRYLVESTEYDDSYDIPVLTAGKTFILGYTNEKNGIFGKDNLPVIIFDDFTTAYKFVDFPFKVKSSAMKILLNKDEKRSDISFIFYRMSTIRFSLGEEHKRYWISEYSKMKIDLPCIEEQMKIAGFLKDIDLLIGSKDNQMKLAESWKKGLMQEMFV